MPHGVIYFYMVRIGHSVFYFYMVRIGHSVFYFYMVRNGHNVSTSISHDMVRNGHSVMSISKMATEQYYIWYEMAMVQNTYGTKWFLVMVRNCNFVVRNGK